MPHMFARFCLLVCVGFTFSGCSLGRPEGGGEQNPYTLSKALSALGNGLALLASSRAERMRESVPTEGTRYCALRHGATFEVIDIKMPSETEIPSINEKYGLNLAVRMPVGASVTCACDSVEDIGISTFTCRHIRQTSADYDFETIQAGCSSSDWQLDISKIRGGLKLRCLP